MFSNKRKLAIFALIVANIIWGFASPIFKLALNNIPPFTLAFLRFFGGMLLLFPFVYKDLKIEKKDWTSLFFVAFFGITINITFFFLGLTRAPSINAPIIASSGPVFLYLFSVMFLSEKPHKKVFGGMLIALCGVLLIVGQPLLERNLEGHLLGNLFFVLATLGAVGHALFSKKIVKNYRPVKITFWSFWIGQLTFIPFFSYELVNLHPFATIDYRGILGLIFGIVFSSTIAYYLFTWGIKQIRAQEVGLFTYIDPLAAILLALPLLGEKITFVYLFGSLLVFTGILIAEGRINYHPLHKLRR